MNKGVRQIVYQSIDSERAYQERDLRDKKWNHQGIPSIEAELLLAEEYLQKARAAWATTNDTSQVLDIFRKVAGIIVRCGEHHGLPPRK